MLNGKFFTGLPEKMMNRAGTGIDRQRTNMYWPEEENSPSVHEFSPSRNMNGRPRPSSRASSSRNSSVSYDSQNSLCDDVNTRDLVRKQRESKIQFYDYDHSVVPPSRTITPSSVAKNLSRESPEADPTNRKLQTLKSRIEFYDYADSAPPAAERTQEPSKQKPQNGNTRPPSRGAGQLLSESETRSAVNKSRDSNFIQDTYAAAEDRTDGHATTTNRTINHNNQHDNGGGDDDEPRRSQKSSSQPREVPIKIEVESATSQEKSRVPPSAGYSLVQRKQLSSSVIDISTLDLDDPELAELKKLKAAPSKNEINKKLATFQTEIRVSNSRTDKSRNSSSPGAAKNSPPRSNLFDDQSHRIVTTNLADNRQRTTDDRPRHQQQQQQQQQQHHRDGRNRDPVSPPAAAAAAVNRDSHENGDDAGAANEARRNAHRHLQSSFSFGAPEPQQQASRNSGTGGRRPYSIRDTAVCRVGVGLPDL